MKKITRTTVKSFLSKATKRDEKIYLRLDSHFSGMSDMVEPIENPKFNRFMGKYLHPEKQLGLGISLVGDGRDYFEEYSDEDFVGYSFYNCVGSGVIAIYRPKAKTKSEKSYNSKNLKKSEMKNNVEMPRRLTMIATGKDLSKVMELEPELPIEIEDMEELAKKIAEACQFIAASDTFKPGTMVGLRKLYGARREIFTEEAAKALKSIGIYAVKDTEEVEEQEAEEVPETTEKLKKIPIKDNTTKKEKPAKKPAKKVVKEEVEDTEEEMPEAEEAKEEKPAKKKKSKKIVYFDKSEEVKGIEVGKIVEFEPAKRLNISTKLVGKITQIHFEFRSNKEYCQIDVAGKKYYKRTLVVTLKK